MTKPRKKMAIALARNFAAGILENSEIQLQGNTGLTEDELALAHEEMLAIAKRINATINQTELDKFSEGEAE